MYAYISELILSARYLAIFVLMAVLPSEAIMPFVGYAAGSGQVSLPLAIIVGTLGSTFGSVVIYLVARLFQEQALYRFMDRRGKLFGLTRKNIRVADKWFDSHAKATVLIGRFIPGVRSAVSIPAGVRRMPLLSFVIYTAIGSGLWVTLLTCMGYLAGSNYETVQVVATNAATVVVVLLLAAVILYVIRKRNSAR